MRKKYSFTASKSSAIKFHDDYLQFYFNKVLFTDSYTFLLEELDRVTSILQSNDIKPVAREEVGLKLIGNSKFADMIDDSL